MDTASALYGAGLLLLGIVFGGFLHATWVERHERREYRRHRSQYLRAKAERLELQNEKWLNDVWADADGSLTDVAPGRLPEPAPIPLHVSEEAKRALRGVNETERFVATAPPATVVAFDTQYFDPPRWPDPIEDDDDRFEDLPTTVDPGVVTDSKERDRDTKSGGDHSPSGAGEHESAADRGGADDLHGGVGEPADEEAGDELYGDHRVHPLGGKLHHPVGQSDNVRLTRDLNPPD